jgi:hypothetical protein
MYFLIDVPTAADDVLALAANGAFKTADNLANFIRDLNCGKHMSMPHRDGTRRSLWPKPGKDRQ